MNSNSNQNNKKTSLENKVVAASLDKHEPK